MKEVKFHVFFWFAPEIRNRNEDEDEYVSMFEYFDSCSLAISE